MKRLTGLILGMMIMFGLMLSLVSVGFAADTTAAPTAPSGLTATAISSSQINLSWTASTDDVGVAGYRIYRDGILRGTIDEGRGTRDELFRYRKG